MLLINKINATIRCYDLNQYAGYNLYAHPFWLKLVQAKEAEICIQVICLRRDLLVDELLEVVEDVGVVGIQGHEVLHRVVLRRLLGRHRRRSPEKPEP